MKLRYSLVIFAIVIAAGIFSISQAVIGQEKKDVAAPPPAQAEDLWTVRCNKPEGEEAKKVEVTKGSCEIFQRLVIADSGQRVVEFAIGFPEGKDAARGVVIMPLGILLDAGPDKPVMQMVIDEAEPFSFKPRYCDASGCYAYISLNGTVLDMLRKGKQAGFLFLDRQGKAIRVNMSLEGISKALKKIS